MRSHKILFPSFVGAALILMSVGTPNRAVAEEVPAPDEPQSAPEPETSDAPAHSDEENGPTPEVGDRGRGGLSLEEAQRISLERNPSIQAMALEIQRAEGLMQQAWASILPNLGVGIQYNLADEPTVVSFDTGASELFGPAQELVVQQQHVAQLTVNVRQPIFNGQSIPAIRLAHLSRDLSRLTVEQVRRQMTLTVAQAFYATLSLRRTIDLLDRNLILAEENVQAARARLEAQAGLAIDVARSELQVETTRSTRVRTLLGFENARDSVAMLLGIPPSELPPLIEPQPVAAEVSSLDDLVDRALADRIDLRVAHGQARAAELNLDSVWMSFAPSLNLNWQLSYTLSEISDFGGRRSMWNLVLVANFPLFDGGTRYGQLRDRRAQIEQAQLNIEALEQSAATQVRQAFRAWRTTLTTLEISGRQHQLAIEAHRLARAAYEAGAASNLEVVDAQRSLIAAEVDREIQRLNVQLSLIELMASTEVSPGGGAAATGGSQR